MEKDVDSWTGRGSNEVLSKVKEDRNVDTKKNERKANLVGHK